MARDPLLTNERLKAIVEDFAWYDEITDDSFQKRLTEHFTEQQIRLLPGIEAWRLKDIERSPRTAHWAQIAWAVIRAYSRLPLGGSFARCMVVRLNGLPAIKVPFSKNRY